MGLLGVSDIPQNRQPNWKLMEFRNQIQSKMEWLSSLRKWYMQSAVQMKKRSANLNHIPQYAQMISELNRAKLETLL